MNPSLFYVYIFFLQNTKSETHFMENPRFFFSFYMKTVQMLQSLAMKTDINNTWLWQHRK